MPREGMRKAQAHSETVPRKFHTVVHDHHLLEKQDFSYLNLYSCFLTLDKAPSPYTILCQQPQMAQKC